MQMNTQHMHAPKHHCMTHIAKSQIQHCCIARCMLSKLDTEKLMFLTTANDRNVIQDSHSSCTICWSCRFFFVSRTGPFFFQRATRITHRPDHLPFLQKLRFMHCFCTSRKATNFNPFPHTSKVGEVNMVLAAEFQVHKHLLVQWKASRCDWSIFFFFFASIYFTRTAR